MNDFFKKMEKCGKDIAKGIAKVTPIVVATSAALSAAIPADTGIPQVELTRAVLKIIALADHPEDVKEDSVPCQKPE